MPVVSLPILASVLVGPGGPGAAEVAFRDQVQPVLAAHCLRCHSAAAGKVKAELDLGLLHNKRGSVIATALRTRPVVEKGQIMAEVRDHVWPLIEAGRIQPVIDRALALQDAAEAHRVVAAGEHVGKVLLVR